MGREPPDCNCEDCKRDTLLGYVVDDRVWYDALARDEPKSISLCLQCLEKRLGRQVELDEFPLLPINQMIRYLLVRCLRFEERK